MRGFEHVDDEFRVHGTKGYIPARATKNSAGYDFKLPIDITIQPGESKLVFSDIKAYMQANDVLHMHIRSSLGKRGVVLSNGTGVIDADYYNNSSTGGNIGLMLRNVQSYPIELKAGERVCQGVFSQYLIIDNDIPVSDIRTGGIGSSGKN